MLEDYKSKDIVKSIDDEGNERIDIVGTVNPQGGVCSCCSKLDYGIKEIKVIGKVYSIEDLHKACDEFSEVDKSWETDYKGAFNFIEWLKEKEKK